MSSDAVEMTGTGPVAETNAAAGRTIERVAWAIIAFGALVRIRQYLGGRSLRYDEARVAYEIADRTFLQMFDVAGFIRVAPPGWFVFEKLSLMAFGTSEYALRLVPLIAGLAALPLFWMVARRYLGDRAGLVCLAFAAVSEHVIYYSSEVKQYSSDVTWCLLALLAVHPLFEGTATRRQWLFAGLIGVASFWFSQPVIFVLAAAGIVLLVHVLRTRRDDLKRVIALGAAWTASLALDYVLILRAQTGRDELINYWRNGFVPLDGVPRAQIDWLSTRLYEYVNMPAGLGSFSLVMFAVAVGIIVMARRQLALAATITLVFAMAMLASVLRVYPFVDRLLLFSVPLLLLVVAAAIDQLNRVGSWRRLRPGTILFVMLIAGPSVHAARVIAQPEGREEIKVAVNYAADRMAPTDGMYLGRSSYGAWLWYSTWTDALRNPPDRTFNGADTSVGADSLRAEIESLRGYRRIWMVFVDYFPQDVAAVLRVVDPIAERREEFTAPGALVYLYEFIAPPDSTAVIR